ncbi:MAG: DUF2237 family protein [Gammaproteobacteria bacterium]|jgi:uncharacterized protein (DUF2237 family)|tara:strand:- start:818 stop:1189 length:372 start_codon:yes stop_codon:yes gene_type:complete
MSESKNVFGEVLIPCSFEPLTGFYRDGCCTTGEEDRGKHTVCAVMTDDFLTFSASRGNDLSTPMEDFGFPGLKAGDRWCLCVDRWVEAWEAGSAPKVVLQSTEESALNYASLEVLKKFAIDLS